MSQEVSIGIIRQIILHGLLTASFLLPLYAQQINIAVLQFDAANINEAEVRILTDRLRTELYKLGVYNVIERSVMEEVLKEQGFQQSGCVSTECVVEVGKLVGVEQMVTGSLGKIGSIYTISARMIDVTTGRMLGQASLDCPCPIETILTESMAQIAAELSGGEITRTLPTPEPGSVLFTSIIDLVQIFDKDDRLLGHTPLTLEEMEPGTYTYTAWKAGYRDGPGIYELKAGQQTSVNIILELMQGTIEITSIPDSVVFLINGDTIGYTPYHNDQMLPGEYILTAGAFSYRDYNEKFTIKDRLTTTLTIELERKRGQLLISPKRSGQQFDLAIEDTVYKVFGQKTLIFLEGNYSAFIKEYGYHDLVKDFSIIDNQTTNIEANNNQILTPIKFNVHPKHATLTFDDRHGVSDLSNLKLPYGNYTVSVNASKYKSSATQFIVNKPETVNLNINLEPKSKVLTRRLSIFIPGAGQLYSDNTIRGIAYILISAGSIALINSTYNNYMDEKDQLDHYQADYRNATTGEDISAAQTLYLNQADVVNDVRTQLITYGVLLGTTWIINIVDAYLFNGLPNE